MLGRGKESTGNYARNCHLVILINGTRCLNIHGTHVTANNSTTNNVVFFFVLDLITVYYNNYLFSIKGREEKYSKLYKQNLAGSLTLTIIPRKAKFIVGYTNFKPQGQ